GRYCYLPLGVHLPERLRPQPEHFLEADDRRPTCPFCSGLNIHRRGLLPNGTQRWMCLDCRRRFVSEEFRTATLDRRKVQHFDDDDPREEAAALFVASRHTGCDFEAMRELIDVSESERRGL